MKPSVLFLAPVLFAVHSLALDPPKDLDVGVYVVRGTELKDLPVEIVIWKTGGAVKHALTDGIIKEDLNGRIRGGVSKILLTDTSELEIFVRTVDGVSAEEYQLLRLRQHSDAREFRSVTGGIFHESGGAERDLVPFTAQKVGSRLWRLILADLQPGEYGFLPPVNTASLAASGKIYSFRVGAQAGTKPPGQSPTAGTLPQPSLLKSLLWPAGDVQVK